jgi:hypothetical protein
LKHPEKVTEKGTDFFLIIHNTFVSLNQQPQLHSKSQYKISEDSLNFRTHVKWYTMLKDGENVSERELGSCIRRGIRYPRGPIKNMDQVMQFSVWMKKVIYVILETDDNDDDDKRQKHERTTSNEQAYSHLIVRTASFSTSPMVAIKRDCKPTHSIAFYLSW